MYALTRRAVLVALMLSVGAEAAARPLSQQSKESKEPAGTIAGRITIGDRPAPNVTVMLMRYNSPSNDQAIARASTDEDGRFRLARVPAGRYYVRPFVPAFTPEGGGFYNHPGKLVTVTEGETIDGVNILLRRGGAITGRVTDASGLPIVEEEIKIYYVDEHDQRHMFYLGDNFARMTDDRGAYRLYGLPAGRYLISAGVETNQGEARMGFGTRFYPITYYSGATDQSKATVIELPQGGEVTGVDITLGRVEKTYIATGRVIDADTGKPLAGVVYSYGPLHPDHSFVGSVRFGSRSDAKGVLRLERLLPGRYAVFVDSTEEGGEYYSDPALFEIIDGNVSGIEVRGRKGSTISGTVAIEGATDPNVSEKLSRLNLYATLTSEQEMKVHRDSMFKVKPDGSFRIAGLPPCKVQIELPQWSRPKDFSLLRIERNGVEQREGIEVSAGEQVSGVKAILVYATGVIRGQVKIEGMDYPDDARMHISIRRAGANEENGLDKQIDSRGRFVIEGLAAGEYEITVSGFIARPGTSQITFKPVTKTATVTNGAELEMTFVLTSGVKDN